MLNVSFDCICFAILITKPIIEMSYFQMKDFGNFEKFIVGYFNPMETCLTQKKKIFL